MLRLLTSSILQSVVEYLHTIGATLRSAGDTGDTVSLNLSKRVALVIHRLWSIFKVLGSLHCRAGQNLMTLFQRVWWRCISLLIDIRIENTRSALLRLGIWLTLLGINLFCEMSALWSCIRVIYGSCCRPLWRSLRQVASGCSITGLLISELRVTPPNLPAILVPSTNRAILLRLSCHSWISCEGYFLLTGLEVVLVNLKPSICRLNHIVVLDGSKVKKRLFLNRFTRVLGLLLHIVPFAWVGLDYRRNLRVFVAWNISHCYRWLFHQQLFNSCNSNPYPNRLSKVNNATGYDKGGFQSSSRSSIYKRHFFP